ncbi:MAG: transposase [Firmicutes bacterium]|nr:transposase [Bacillota bacterium]
MVDLKTVYQALTLEEAEMSFAAFKEKWGKKHPIVIRSWQNNWLELTTYFKYPYEIRRMIYTTNIIEGYPFSIFTGSTSHLCLWLLE